LGIRLFKEPELENPTMVACWPGIGSIGLIAIDTLKSMLDAEEFGEIEAWDFFYPKRVLIRNGELEELEFPASKFYFKRAERKDFLFFIGEEQPADGGKAYAEGKKAYQMANMVIDVAQRFGCQRIYTSGAAVAPIHHTARPKVWAVPNTKELIGEIKKYDNTILMSDIEERGRQGNITGLNGLLLGAAKKRGIGGICVMGEIPIYLQGLPIAYPKASRSVLEVLAAALGIKVDLAKLNAFISQSEREIELLYDRFPPEIKEHLEKLRQVTHAKPTEPGPITEEDKKRILEDIDKFFKKGPKED
jgi:proteasome assembly chaperone (PAC2) family protein